MCLASFDVQNPLFSPISILHQFALGLSLGAVANLKSKWRSKTSIFFNVDANWDPDIDDMTLLHICTYMEKDHEAFERM